MRGMKDDDGLATSIAIIASLLARSTMLTFVTGALGILLIPEFFNVKWPRIVIELALLVFVVLIIGNLEFLRLLRRSNLLPQVAQPPKEMTGIDESESID
jgi:hypothetical protein